MSLLALPFFHLSFQCPLLWSHLEIFTEAVFSVKKKTAGMSWGSKIYTHAKAQDAPVTGRTVNGWPGLPWPGMKSFQGWGTATLRAEDKSHVNPVQISESTMTDIKLPPRQMTELAFSFMASINWRPLTGWRVSSSGVSRISASLPKNRGIMRDCCRQSLGSTTTTVSFWERRKEAIPSHLLLLTHLF